ncbi:hypothetical protein ACP5YT_001779 [Cronobacter malonaticus]|uniref:hypothetical protein n=1 Tax=Enterobacteriaceae TaxID=543 RepID=UPI000E202B89|nr:hypothetical protein [Klebsiella pneumoniae]HBS7132983.1 hypothetical protein [Klebsiella pneumoniae]HBX7801605.1 hypothetical protein [Klebsiella pneumoniae]
MGRKKRNPIKRIEQATRASKRKYSNKLKDYSKESIPGEMVTTIIEHPPTVPTGSEFELLKDVLSSTDKLYYKPRRRREYIIDSSQLKPWQIIGFEHYADYVGYSQTNGLSGHTADLDFLFNDDKENYND